MSNRFDYIVIGAGSAGCVVANRLSSDKNKTVLLLEAGKSNHPLTRIPVSFALLIDHPTVNWRYRSNPDEKTSNRNIPIPRGKLVGGSSTINGLVYVRGQSLDYDIWAQMGNKGWSSEEVFPFFKKLENYVNPCEDLRGKKGLVNISQVTDRNLIYDAMFEAGEKLNIPFNEDYNSGDQEGFAFTQTTIFNGKRMSAKVAYIDPIKNRKNLEIITHAHVKKIIFENKVAKGVEFWQGDELKKVQANREIILSSGSIGSPQILQVSGIGNPEKLKKLGIEIVQNLNGVGENLHDHLMLRPIYKINGLKSLNKKINSLFGNLMIGLEYIFKRTGPMTMGASQLCMFAKSDSSLELPDLQWHVQPMSMDTLGATKNHDFHAFTPTVSNIKPTSRGHVSIVDKDSRTYAKIKQNYLSTDNDRMIAAKGLKLTRKIIMESETFKKYSPEEYRPGININDDEELVKEASNYAQTIFHPVGTCKMGQDEMSVVDEKLRVRGVRNLRVIDASIMPNITSGNTNAPTIMIAEKGADMILNH